MKIEDEKMNDLLKRAEEHRRDLANSRFGSFEDLRNQETFQAFFGNDEKKIEIDDKNNIFVKCEISKEEALNGCKKKIEYRLKNENGKKEKNKIFLEIPSNIKKGSKILLHNCGNYMKEKGVYSHLVVEVKIK